MNKQETDRTIKCTAGIECVSYHLEIRKLGVVVYQTIELATPPRNFKVTLPRGGRRHLVSVHATPQYKVVTSKQHNTICLSAERDDSLPWTYIILVPNKPDVVKITVIYASIKKYHRETTVDIPAVDARVNISVDNVYNPKYYEIRKNNKKTFRQESTARIVATKPSACVFVAVYEEKIKYGTFVIPTPTGKIVCCDSQFAIPNRARTRIATNPLTRKPTQRHIIGPIPPWNDALSQTDLMLAHLLADNQIQKPSVDWVCVGKDIKRIGYSETRSSTTHVYHV